jgi:tRNA uracil 4-sulfurtransferase
MRRRPARSTPSTWGSDTPRKGILLLSGGFDSPVAGHLMSRQGLELVAAHFSLEPITDDAAAVKARTLCGILDIGSLYVVRVGEAFAEIAHAANRRFYFILTKRLMVRLADAIGDREQADVLVTGENLGQVSSQTLASLRAIDAVARRPVLRPLIGFDKQEVVDRAKEIGTYEVSKGPEICDLLGPPRPSTHARLDQILLEEAKLDPDSLVASSLSGVVAERFKGDGSARRVPAEWKTAA